MKLTIIPIDNSVIIDGVGYHDIDMTGIDTKIHSIQWSETYGSIEYTDGTLKDISDIKKYNSFVSLHKEKAEEIKNARKPGADYFVWDDNKRKWVEDPILKKKSFKPDDNTLSWNDEAGDWVEDPILKKKLNKPEEPYFVWDKKRNDWSIDKSIKAKYDIIVGVNDARSYLLSTDFYYARKLETGKDVPKDVVSKRITSREYIINNETDNLVSSFNALISAKNI